MRLLYIDCSVEAVNPTASLTPLLAARVSEDVTYFGPGYSSHSDLDGGIARFADRQGPFDVVLIGPHASVLHRSREQAEASAAYISKFCALAPKRDQILNFFNGLPAELPRINARLRVISLLNFDYYATTRDQLDRIDELGLDIWGPNRQFVSRLHELPDYATQEKHYKAKASRLSDTFAEFLERNPERVFPAVHFVADTEFHLRNLDERRYTVGVPGVEYVLRKQAIKRLRETATRIAPKTVFHLYRALGRIGMNIYARYVTLKLYQLTFRQSLFDTRFVYTARGGFGIPIRKFFEIPAAGALMFCSSPNGFAALGFRDGEAFVEAPPDALPERVGQLLREPERAQQIAQRGQQVTWRSHTLEARARQLRVMLDARLSGTYAGARWVDGNVKIERREQAL